MKTFWAEVASARDALRSASSARTIGALKMMGRSVMDRIPWKAPAALHVKPAFAVGPTDARNLREAVANWLELPEAAQGHATISLGDSAEFAYVEWTGHGISWLADRLPR
jgi:hypothetical protein